MSSRKTGRDDTDEKSHSSSGKKGGKGPAIYRAYAEKVSKMVHDEHSAPGSAPFETCQDSDCSAWRDTVRAAGDDITQD